MTNLLIILLWEMNNECHYLLGHYTPAVMNLTSVTISSTKGFQQCFTKRALAYFILQMHIFNDRVYWLGHNLQIILITRQDPSASGRLTALSWTPSYFQYWHWVVPIPKMVEISEIWFYAFCHIATLVYHNMANVDKVNQHTQIEYCK